MNPSPREKTILRCIGEGHQVQISCSLILLHIVELMEFSLISILFDSPITSGRCKADKIILVLEMKKWSSEELKILSFSYSKI